MDDNESVVVVPSESTMVDTPSEETTKPATPADEGATPEGGATTPQPSEVLYDLPDGRKVDAATLSKEWRENFYPDYTRKSQELSAFKNAPASPLQDNKPTAKPYESPDWTPGSYGELINIAKQELRADLEAEEKALADERIAIENEVVAQINELKLLDPKLDENSLFLHANKYGFRDLRQAYANMKDMGDVIKKTQTVTAQNIAKRNDPVSIFPGATGGKPNPSNFGTAVDYLRSLK